MATLPQNAVVWAEIPVTDLDKGMAFYGKVLGNDLVMNHDGPQPIAMFAHSDPVNSVAGHLYVGKPAKDAGPTVHFAVPDSLEAARDRVFDAGGTSGGDPIPIPAGRFIYASDPDGNSIGLFEFS